MNSNIKFVINKNSFALNTLKKRKFLLKLQKFNYPSNLNDAKASFEEKTKFIILDSPIVSRKWINYFREKNIKTLGIFSNTYLSKPTDYKLFPESNIFINSSKVKSGIEFSLLSSEYWRQNKISKKKKYQKCLNYFWRV